MLDLLKGHNNLNSSPNSLKESKTRIFRDKFIHNIEKDIKRTFIGMGYFAIFAFANGKKVTFFDTSLNRLWIIFILDLIILIKYLIIELLNDNNSFRLFNIREQSSYLLTFSLILQKKGQKMADSSGKHRMILCIFLKYLIIMIVNGMKETQNSFNIMDPHLFHENILWSVGFGCVLEKIDQGMSFENQNIDISQCFFSRTSEYNYNGGVIYVNGSYTLKVQFSMFYNCVSSQTGGAIYISILDSYLKMICANRCTGSYGHFARLRASQTNQVELISVSFCSYSPSGYSPLIIEDGNQRIDNTNSSMNKANMVSGISNVSPSSFTSSFCTFSNNNVLEQYCIILSTFRFCVRWLISYFVGPCVEWSYETETISYANIIHNNSPSGGVIYVQFGSLQMMGCIFHNNHNYLFSGRSIIVSDSFIDHSSSFSTDYTVNTYSNNLFTRRMTYQIPYFYSYYCKSDYPMITPAETVKPSRTQTMMRTNQETLRKTLEKTIAQTIKRTPQQTSIKTANPSSMRTYKETLRITLEKTIAETIKTTPEQTIIMERTYDPQCGSKILSSENYKRYNLLKSFPIFISLMIV